MHLSLGVDSGKITSCAAIAGASEDGNASTMLAKDITTALCDDSVTDDTKVLIAVKEQMTAWYSAFGSGIPPSIQYVLATAVGGNCSLWFCSPPNTILPRHDPFAVGAGGAELGNQESTGTIS